LLQYIYTANAGRKIALSGLYLQVLKFLARDSVFGPSISHRPLRYATLALAEYHLATENFTSRCEHYIQLAVSALVANPQEWRVGDWLAADTLPGWIPMSDGNIKTPLLAAFMDRAIHFETEKGQDWDLLSEILPVFLFFQRPRYRASAGLSNIFYLSNDFTEAFQHLLDYEWLEQTSRVLFPRSDCNGLPWRYIVRATSNITRIFAGNAETESSMDVGERRWHPMIHSLDRSLNSSVFQKASLWNCDDDLGSFFVTLHVWYCRLLVALLKAPTIVASCDFGDRPVPRCGPKPVFAAYSSGTWLDWCPGYMECLLTRYFCVAEIAFVGATRDSDSSSLPFLLDMLILQMRQVHREIFAPFSTSFMNIYRRRGKLIWPPFCSNIALSQIFTLFANWWILGTHAVSGASFYKREITGRQLIEIGDVSQTKFCDVLRGSHCRHVSSSFRLVTFSIGPHLPYSGSLRTVTPFLKCLYYLFTSMVSVPFR
jgi:hypothetical protein